MSIPAIVQTASAVAQVAGAGAEKPSGERVATDFAALLVQQLVREMFETVKEGEGPFGSGPGADVQRGIAETAVSSTLAENGFAAVRDAIMRAISGGEKNAASDAVDASDTSNRG